MTSQPKIRQVSVDLQDSEDTRALVEAIEEDNPDADLLRMPGLVRVQAPKEIVIRRETVEQRMGREWETHEFQMNIVSYSGHIADWDDDQIVIKWEH
jgi:phenol/toluene 2-monooxygenase (NADH) P2/A2